MQKKLLTVMAVSPIYVELIDYSPGEDRTNMC